MTTPTSLEATLQAFARESLEACDAVLARIWTVGPGDSCAKCPMRPECPDQRACLHLVVSVGLTTRLDGPFRRFPIGARRVGRVVSERQPYVERGDLAARGIAEPGWLAVHGVRSFAAVPLGEGGRGVLAVFSRRFLTDQEVHLLAFAARAVVRGGPGAPPAPPRAPRPAGADAPVVAPHPAPAPELRAEADRRTLAEIEREAIERALVQTAGRISGPRGAATMLGLKPSTLASRMQKLGVRRPR
jgi:transcriptional regulator with GAF, ATPase, and Fis domain